MKILCYPCKEAHGEDVEATNLVPQETDTEGAFHWLPVCEGHLDGWYDDCDEEFCKMKPINLTLYKEG